MSIYYIMKLFNVHGTQLTTNGNVDRKSIFVVVINFSAIQNAEFNIPLLNFNRLDPCECSVHESLRNDQGHIEKRSLKRANGYKPFLYNLTVDVCKFLKTKNPNPVAKYLYDAVWTFSNINHSWPFNHDIFIDKVNTSFVNSHVKKLLPFPKGDYRLDSRWNINKKSSVSLRFFFNLGCHFVRPQRNTR